MRIYISGQITGLNLKTAKEKFFKKQKELESNGYLVINPFEVLEYNPDLSWKDYMIADIKALLNCDAIFMLNNYHNSKGALLELHIAEQLGLKIIFE